MSKVYSTIAIIFALFFTQITVASDAELSHLQQALNQIQQQQQEVRSNMKKASSQRELNAIKYQVDLLEQQITRIAKQFQQIKPQQPNLADSLLKNRRSKENPHGIERKPCNAECREKIKQEMDNIAEDNKRLKEESRQRFKDEYNRKNQKTQKGI